MITFGLWWLDQWHKAHQPYYKFMDDKWYSAPASVMYASGTAIAPAIAAGVSPYGQLQRVQIGLEDYTRRRAYSGKRFDFDVKSGKFKFSRPLSRRLMMKGGAKLASRAIPYVGWSLLAVDLWHVGKWIGEKTSPFD